MSNYKGLFRAWNKKNSCLCTIHIPRLIITKNVIIPLFPGRHPELSSPSHLNHPSHAAINNRIGLFSHFYDGQTSGGPSHFNPRTSGIYTFYLYRGTLLFLVCIPAAGYIIFCVMGIVPGPGRVHIQFVPGFKPFMAYSLLLLSDETCL